MNTCTVCSRPIRKRNRTVHVTCMPQADEVVAETGLRLHTCVFCHSTETSEVAGAYFCADHLPGEVQHTSTYTQTPDKCPKCGEYLTPGVTKGSIKCKCDMPKMPRHLRNRADDDRPPMQVRYGYK